MTHTVGLIGANGNVGKATLEGLLPHAQQGKIKLVVLHRPGSKVAAATGKNVELRELPDLQQTDAAALKQPLADINVLVAAIAPMHVPGTQEKLVDALVGSKELVTFIPSNYATPFTKQDFEHPQLGPVLKGALGIFDYAKSKGVPVTRINAGAFDYAFFMWGALGSSLKANELTLNDGMLKHWTPITSPAHIGAVIADFVAGDPKKIANTTHTVVTWRPTGNELKDIYSNINGKPPTVKPFGEKEQKEWLANGHQAMAAGSNIHWANNDFEIINDAGSWNEAPPLEQVARQWA